VITQSIYRPNYGLDGPEFESWQDREIFLFSDTFRPSVGPIRPTIQRLPGKGGSVSVVKRPERDIEH
jgi:hypothetical protein